MLFVVRRFSMYESHETNTKLNVSVAFKLTIIRFLNSTIVLVGVNRDTSKMFDGGGLVYEATILIIIMCF